MSLITYIILCVVVGLIVYACNLLPIPAQIKNLILIAAVIVLVLVLLSAMGIFSGGDVMIPRIRN